MYNAQLKEEIEKRLQEFIQAEMGNRLTLNNWNYLILTLVPIFERNEIKGEIKDDSGDE